VIRPSRVLLPLAAALVFFGLYWFIHGHLDLFKDTRVDAKIVENVTLFLVVIPAILLIVRILDLVAFDIIATKRRRVHAPVLLREIVSIALYIILFAWAISTIFQYKVTALLATGTVVAAVLGLALQETLGNLFAGIALHLEDSFEIGDVIRSGDQMGVVEGVRWRGTRLRTFANTIVIVPNSMLARDRLEVFPRNNQNARVLQIGIDYNIPPATVVNVLGQAASNVDGVSSIAPAFARVAGFADSSIVYEIKYHTTDFSQRDRIDADIRKAVWYALRRNGIPIPFPIRSIQRYHAPSMHQPATADIAQRLAGIDILSPLSEEESRSIAGAARVHTYSKGETIIRRGAAGDSMFIVHDGVVSVRVGDQEVARLGEGDLFGEMALLTGEMRAADVVALSDVVAVEIAKGALRPVLHDHPGLATSISTKVMERRGSLESLKEASREEAQRTILSRIRAYFGL
jgi:small-conductance mechanosensitive channel/CRP-like cAMP-binding protein